MTEKRPLTFTLFFLRLLSGFGGGIAGTLSAFVVYFVMAMVIPAQASSLSVFTVIVMAFVATLVSNVSSAVMVSFMDSEKYSRRKTMLTHIFIFNVALFFLTVPMYVLGASAGIAMGIAAVHFMVSAFVSVVIMEILSGSENSLLGVYSSALGIFFSIAVALIMLSGNVNSQVLIFGAMPFTLLMIQLSAGLTELIYDNYIRYYGVHALNASTDLGGDEREKEEEEAAKKEEKEDEDGDDDERD